MINADSPWFLRRPGAAPLRLYCLPYAGGSANAYAAWQPLLPPAIALCAVQLPGRGNRFREAPYAALEPLVEALADALAGEHGPYALFGHSMGALLAFELARRLQRLGRRPPERVLVSGCAAPRYRDRPRQLHREDDAGLLAALADYNGTPPELLRQRELMDLLLPMIRADFSVVETYSYRPGPLLTVPLTVLAGRADARTSAAQVDGWLDETAAGGRVHWFDGDHFFINSARAQVVARVGAELAGASVLPAM